jgi:hypothetical protein
LDSRRYLIRESGAGGKERCSRAEIGGILTDSPFLIPYASLVDDKWTVPLPAGVIEPFEVYERGGTPGSPTDPLLPLVGCGTIRVGAGGG